MPSPFPGMDPYLEGYLWPDVHHRLATQISRQLAPQIQPNYVARLEISVIEDAAFTAEVGVMYPDVEVLKIKQASPPPPTSTGGAAVLEAEAILTAPLTIPLPQVRLVSVEIRDVAQNQLVTSIEILSPVNKREPHLSQYRLKRLRLHEAGVHLLEIDLLRRGSRPWMHPRIPETPYLALLTRAEIPAVEVWPIRWQDNLPVLPVPLRHPDKDVLLDLAAALTAVYDEAYYHLSVDYSQEPPPPPLAEGETAWLREQIKI
ncbi:MAG: DUF4058 family protein [Anaerolineales bacterium]|nr:DUF4058 family protein [Anaerolineales bacterium]